MFNMEEYLKERIDSYKRNLICLETSLKQTRKNLEYNQRDIVNFTKALEEHKQSLVEFENLLILYQINQKRKGRK